jgi:limonene 1,2-monooxygenase
MYRVGQNPTLPSQRDLELTEHLDRLGFDEAWIEKHHSAGYETVASLEVFIGAASQRRNKKRRGTAVPLLFPYFTSITFDTI